MIGEDPFYHDKLIHLADGFHNGMNWWWLLIIILIALACINRIKNDESIFNIFLKCAGIVLLFWGIMSFVGWVYYSFLIYQS